jgi:molybdate transport system substrate-binding protein
MSAFTRLRLAGLLIVVLLLLPPAAAADELRVMTSGTFTAALLELAPRFERATGHTVVAATTTMGVGANSIPSRLQRREPADVVILDDDAMRQLIAEGHVLADSRTPLARSGIGMAVRAGAAKPDISTVDALRRTLLQATSIAYSASVSGRYLTTELFQKLGIAEQVSGKSRRIEGERVGAVVARGEAEIGFQQTSELLPVPGIEYVGPLPSGVQRVSVFSAGVPVHSEHPAAAASLILFLASAEASVAVTRSGLETVAR